MNLVLSPQTQKLLEERMTKGGYHTADEAVRAGLEYLSQHEQSGDFQPGEMATLLAEANAEIERGEILEGQTVFDEIHQLSQAYREKQKSG
jgi:Arc/MetJ-type ribon-helix-helix transcriptional regulator